MNDGALYIQVVSALRFVTKFCFCVLICLCKFLHSGAERPFLGPAAFFITMQPVRFILFCILMLAALVSMAQAPDSIWFDLYADSLKKGSWNYINVVGRFSGGKIFPVSSAGLRLQASVGKVEDGSIWIDWKESADSVHVDVQLIKHPSMQKSITIWIKKEDRQMEPLPADTLLHKLNERLQRKPGRRGKGRITEISSRLPETSPILYQLKDV